MRHVLDKWAICDLHPDSVLAETFAQRRSIEEVHPDVRRVRYGGLGKSEAMGSP